MATAPPTRYGIAVTLRRSNAVAEVALKASVLPLADRAQRIASMLDRWEAEETADEPEWDVGDIERIRLRPPSIP